MDSQEEKCCLCMRVFEGSNMTKKRRRLHGESAEKTRSVLNLFCIETYHCTVVEVKKHGMVSQRIVTTICPPP